MQTVDKSEVAPYNPKKSEFLHAIWMYICVYHEKEVLNIYSSTFAQVMTKLL